MSQTGIEYWNTLSTEELEDTRNCFQREIDAGYSRKEDRRKWIAEIGAVLESRKDQRV